MRKGAVVAVCLSHNKGEPKQPIPSIFLIEGVGVEGDAHAGFGHRQVSLLNYEDILEVQTKLPWVKPGSFAENISVRDFDLTQLKIGERLKVGETILEVTQIGKECHSHCEIFRLTGDCIMPKKGYFAKVILGGCVRPGDEVFRMTE